MTASPSAVTTEQHGLDAVSEVTSWLRRGDSSFGRRLLVVGSRPAAVRGAHGAVVALDAEGVAVLVVVLETAAAGTGADIADELDRLAFCAVTGLTGPGRTEDVAVAHGRFFPLPQHGRRPELNVEQQAVVVVRRAPDREAWEDLIVEIGGQLAGVYLREPGGATSLLDVPEELRPQRRGWSPVTAAAFLAIAALLLTAAVVLRPDEPGRGPATSAAAARATAHEVAADVAPSSTHNRWIGQTHLVRVSDGTLLAVYGTGDGLQIVADHADRGTLWRPPTTLAIPVTSSSVVVDAGDRLHVAFSDGHRIAYTTVTGGVGAWTSSRPVEVAAATTTPYVDIAYDEAADVAHVVWAEAGPSGQAPRWAAISAGDGLPRVLQTQSLAPPGDDMPVLVNIATALDGPIIASYRRGDRLHGWFARALVPSPRGGATWRPEERVPTDAGIGAAALAVDRWGTAHLVLRDSTTFALRYFSRIPGRGWSGGEIAVDAATTAEIDFPSLSLDRSSRLVHLFFHSDRAQRAPGVQVAVRDPVRGWGSPAPVVPAESLPDGAFFPTSLTDADGLATVLWTTGGGSPALQAASVAP